MLKYSDLKTETENKEKFFRKNIDIFLKYFESREQYNALLNAGNIKKIEKIIKENSQFNSEQVSNLLGIIGKEN